MSFTGDLEHLSIIDLIQLLHTTRKSGTLSVRGRKGESQLVFSDGYIVSANHVDNSIRIGRILVDAGAITQETLTKALQEQEQAGAGRKPLVATLIEGGHVGKKEAYNGLEHLIELTVVEILTWKKGSFGLDVENLNVADDYRYFPEKLKEEIIINTQNVLMDALRIYDEKKRDGELVEETDDEPAATAAPADEDLFSLSADDLGLADLDQLDRKLPELFATLEDRDPLKIHREALEAIETNLSPEELDEVIEFLAKFCPPGGAGQKHDATEGSLILFSADELVRYAVTTVCKQEGILVFTSNDEPDLDPIIDQFLSKNIAPILVIDAPEKCGPGFTNERVHLLRQQKKVRYPGICTIQLVAGPDPAFPLQAYVDGARAVLPRPLREEYPVDFAGPFISFLEAMAEYVRGYAHEQSGLLLGMLLKTLPSLREQREARDVALAILQFTARIFGRAVTLIVGEGEVIAEKGIGVKAETDWGVTPDLNFRIPLTKPSLLGKVIEEGRIFFGKTEDELIRTDLHRAIGTPLRSTVLLLPLKCYGRTICLTYADFGSRELSPVQTGVLEVLAAQAGVVLENALYRKSFTKSSR